MVEFAPLKTGTSTIINGEKVEIKEISPLYVTYVGADGKEYTSKKTEFYNDLFGINNELPGYNDSFIKAQEKAIEEGKEEVKYLSKLHDLNKEAIHKNMKLKIGVLRSAGVTNATQLDAETKAEYDFFAVEQSSARRAMHRATSDILSVTNKLISIILSKGKAQLQNIYAQSIAQ